MSPGSMLVSDSSYTEDQEEPELQGVLQVHIHEAQGIHNICIYDKQDVFAKFSFTHGKSEPYCTRVVTKGGRDPVFDESFELPVTRPNSVLKCEMWMSSRAHAYLEDQLLGFVLVPVSDKLTDKSEEYGLSSTELFHSPAGTVRLTMFFRENLRLRTYSEATDATHSETDQQQHMFIKVFDDGQRDSPALHESCQLIDLDATTEDQKLVSNYSTTDSSTDLIITGPAFLFEKDAGSSEPRTTSSDEHSESSFESGSSKKSDKANGTDSSDSETVVQQQIVDMYMKSMQQFTEALAKMQLPTLELDKSEANAPKKSKSLSENGGKKHTHRVFYGSRAFF